MPTLEMPNSGTSVNLPPTTSQGDTPTREKTNGAQSYDVEDSESEPEPDKQAPEGATNTESPMVAYLEQVFSKRLDAMQSKGVMRSYHVQEVRLNPDRTRLAMVHQPTLQDHSLLRYSQR